MGKYTDLVRKHREGVQGENNWDSSVSVKIDNMHSNNRNSVDRPITERPKPQHERSPSVDVSQSVASGSKSGEQNRALADTNLRTTNLTNLIGEVPCIHGTTQDKCCVCTGYARWLIADEGRVRRAQVDPDGVRREFWRSRNEGTS